MRDDNRTSIMVAFLRLRACLPEEIEIHGAPVTEMEVESRAAGICLVETDLQLERLLS